VNHCRSVAILKSMNHKKKCELPKNNWRTDSTDSALVTDALGTDGLRTDGLAHSALCLRRVAATRWETLENSLSFDGGEEESSAKNIRAKCQLGGQSGFAF
jgi:hypothetical protein